MGSETRMNDLLRAQVPFEEETEFVLTKEREQGKVLGLVLVDIVNGFCTVGAGNLVCFQFFLIFTPISKFRIFYRFRFMGSL